MFKPSTEQSKILAKVAKIDVWEEIETNNLCYYLSPYSMDDHVEPPWKEWEPENSRDQIAMIIEGLTDEQEVFFHRKIHEEWWNSNGKFSLMLFGMKVHPSISCEKLLEVIG